LLAISMAVAMRQYDTACIAWWRRFVGFIKATKRHHRASTRSDITNRSSQCWDLAWFWGRGVGDGTILYGGSYYYIGVWHIKMKTRTWQRWWNTYMGVLVRLLS
jgi:hypothetical protein